MENIPYITAVALVSLVANAFFLAFGLMFWSIIKDLQRTCKQNFEMYQEACDECAMLRIERDDAHQRLSKIEDLSKGFDWSGDGGLMKP